MLRRAVAEMPLASKGVKHCHNMLAENGKVWTGLHNNFQHTHTRLHRNQTCQIKPTFCSLTEVILCHINAPKAQGAQQTQHDRTRQHSMSNSTDV